MSNVVNWFNILPPEDVGNSVVWICLTFQPWYINPAISAVKYNHSRKDRATTNIEELEALILKVRTVSHSCFLSLCFDFLWCFLNSPSVLPQPPLPCFRSSSSLSCSQTHCTPRFPLSSCRQSQRKSVTPGRSPALWWR